MPNLEFSKVGDDWNNDYLSPDQIIVKDKLSKKGKWFRRENDKFIIWKIRHKFGFNPKYKAREPIGSVTLAQIWKNSPNKLSFKNLAYNLSNGKATGQFVNTKYYIIIKNGRINLYKRVQGAERGYFNVSNRPNSILDNLNLSQPIHFRRFIRIVNEFFKDNKIKSRLKYELVKNNSGKIDETIMLNVLAEQLISIIYPGVKCLNRKFVYLDGSLSKFLREPMGLKRFIKKCFGAAGSKLTNTLLQSLEKGRDKLEYFIAGVCFKGLIPFDYYHKILESYNGPNNFYWGLGRPRSNQIRRFLRNFSEKRRINLILDEVDKYYIKDTITIYDNIWKDIIIPTNLKTWRELHDYIAKESIKLGNKSREINYKKEWKELDGAKVGDMEIIIPKLTTDMVEWGQNLRFCLGSKVFQDNAVAGRVLYLAINKENKLKYCLEVRPGKQMGEFRGNYNFLPDKEDEKLILDYLTEKDIIMTQDKKDCLELAAYAY